MHINSECISANGTSSKLTSTEKQAELLKHTESVTRIEKLHCNCMDLELVTRLFINLYVYGLQGFPLPAVGFLSQDFPILVV